VWVDFPSDLNYPVACSKTNVLATGPWGKRISLALNSRSDYMNPRS